MRDCSPIIVRMLDARDCRCDAAHTHGYRYRVLRKFFTPTYAGGRPAGTGRGTQVRQAASVWRRSARGQPTRVVTRSSPAPGASVRNYVRGPAALPHDGFYPRRYSYPDFKTRVEVTQAFVEEILKYSATPTAPQMQRVADACSMPPRALDGPPCAARSRSACPTVPKATAGGVSGDFDGPGDARAQPALQNRHDRRPDGQAHSAQGLQLRRFCGNGHQWRPTPASIYSAMNRAWRQLAGKAACPRHTRGNALRAASPG